MVPATVLIKLLPADKFKTVKAREIAFVALVGFAEWQMDLAAKHEGVEVVTSPQWLEANGARLLDECDRYAKKLAAKFKSRSDHFAEDLFA
jgi:hypothetical protein